MKKRLLITSIVMMLVVAVALSTATYAWFTSNASVTASTVTMTAATNNQAALGIGWGDSSAQGASAGTELVSNLSETLAPMAPTELTNDSTTSAVLFKTSTVKTVSNTLIFNANGGTATPVTFNNGSEVNTFFVKNVSPSSSINDVKITATITDTNTEDGKDSAALVRIAVFKKASGSYKLVGVLASTGADTVYGTITQNSAAVPGTAALGAINGTTYTVSTMQNYTATAAGTGLLLGQLAAGAAHDLMIIAWLDGAALNDSTQGIGATISFDFSAVSA